MKTGIREKLDFLEAFIDPVIESDIEAKVAWDNLQQEIDNELERKNNRIESLLEENNDLDSQLNEKVEDKATSYIDFEKLDTLWYYFEKGNIWGEQIMEALERIIGKRGVKYLLDRLEITVKSLK